MSTLQKYLLHNEINDSSFNNSSTKEFLIDKMLGGQCCSGTNVFKYTLQKFNNNQRTISGNVLQGGRVSLPSQYFGKPNTVYKPSVTFSKISTLTPSLAKQALPSTQFGGKTNFSSIDTFLTKGMKGGGADRKELLNMYHNNLDAFINNVKTLSGGHITKTNIKESLKLLKN